MTEKEILERVRELALTMASYAHHMDYGDKHTQPEITCKNPDCEAVRKFIEFQVMKETK